MELFYWNGVCNTDYNIDIIDVIGKYSIPKKQYESIEVPGRTGNLLIDTGATLNKTITIDCCLVCTGLDAKQTATKMKEIQDWLISPIGYQLLEFNDGLKFNAILSQLVEVTHKHLSNVLTFKLIFECFEVIE